MKSFVAIILFLALFGGVAAITLETPVGEIFDISDIESQSGSLPFDPTDTLGEAAQKGFDYIMDMVEWAMGVYKSELGSLKGVMQ